MMVMSGCCECGTATKETRLVWLQQQQQRQQQWSILRMRVWRSRPVLIKETLVIEHSARIDALQRRGHVHPACGKREMSEWHTGTNG